MNPTRPPITCTARNYTGKPRSEQQKIPKKEEIKEAPTEKLMIAGAPIRQQKRSGQVAKTSSRRERQKRKVGRKIKREIQNKDLYKTAKACRKKNIKRSTMRSQKLKVKSQNRKGGSRRESRKRHSEDENRKRKVGRAESEETRKRANSKEKSEESIAIGTCK